MRLKLLVNGAHIMRPGNGGGMGNIFDNIFIGGDASTERAAAITRKFQRVLEAKSVSMTLRQLKSLDTIEIAGTAPNGQERVLINDVKRQFGVEALRASEAGKVLLPFIPEGVLKSRSKDRVYYTYFRVEDPGKDSEVFNLVVADHQLCDGVFQLKCFGNATGLPKVMAGTGTKLEAQFAPEGFPDFLDAITDDDLLKEMSAEEAGLLREAAAKSPNKELVSEQVRKLYNYLITTFRAINFLNEQKRLAAKAEEGLPDAKAGQAEASRPSGTGPSLPSGAGSSRTITMGDWYKYRSQKPHGASGRAFVRRTEQWLVTGHIRHYKSGKTVYINPYYKGPGREKERIGKTVITIKERGKDKDE